MEHKFLSNRCQHTRSQNWRYAWTQTGKYDSAMKDFNSIRHKRIQLFKNNKLVRLTKYSITIIIINPFSKTHPLPSSLEIYGPVSILYFVLNHHLILRPTLLLPQVCSPFLTISFQHLPEQVSVFAKQ